MSGAASARDLLGATPLSKCIGGTAACFADPCGQDLQNVGCPFATAPKGTTCYPSYCNKAQYTHRRQTYTVGPCGLLVIDDSTGAVVCGTGTVSTKQAKAMRG